MRTPWGWWSSWKCFNTSPGEKATWGPTEEERAKSVERALPLLTRELLPYRNLTFQLWGEMTFRTVEYTKLIKATDPKRLVTNSPGGSGVLGTTQENLALDYLAPHTTRQSGGRHWEIVPTRVRLPALPIPEAGRGR